MPDTTIASVFISYSHRDRAWRDRIASRLESRVLVKDDTQLEPGDLEDDRLRAMREEARVAILVVTQNFLASKRIQQRELPHLLQLRNSTKLRLLPVIAEASNWSAVEALSSFQVFPTDGFALSSHSADEVERYLDLLDKTVMDLLQEPPAPPTPEVKRPAPKPAPARKRQSPEWLTAEAISRFSDEGRAILGHADQIRTGRGQQLVHIPHVLLALAVRPGSQLSQMLSEAGASLEELIGSDQSGVEDSDGGGSFKGLPPMSANVRRALVNTRDKADEGHFGSITASHLLYGVLSVSKNAVVAALNQLGITPDRVEPPFKIRAKPSRKPFAGYQSDDPTGKDLLEIGKEVEDLASVLAARDVNPPLSLGLFGDWGSGKSFFMRQLESRINLLKDDARKAQGDSAFCQDIVQITFNAWNYIDTDLWASLAAEIFEGLAAAIALKRGKDSQDERALELTAASSSEVVLTEAERKRCKAEVELADSEQRLALLRQKESGIEAKLSPVEGLQTAYRLQLGQEGVQQHLDAAVKELHISEAKAATTEIGGEILALRGIASTIYFAIRKREHSWIWIAALGATLATAAWLAPTLLHTIGLGELASRVLSMLTVASVFLAPFVRWAQKAQRTIGDARAAKEQVVEQQRKQRTAELEAEHDRIKKRVEQARGDVEAATATLTALDKQLEQMLADRRMADYIRQRHESSDYTRHLGVIARLRGDFMHLSNLLRDVRTESAAATELEKTMRKRLAEQDGRAAARFPRIDRIILYIDDLDRCPEKIVVEVLQAVHLLLAFPLFVVVVGVDPRWLLHSLQKQSAAFQLQPDETGSAPSEEDLHWKSTHLNYLEKIFQIPSPLRPIDRTGFARLVDSFAAPRSSPAPSAAGGAVASIPGGAAASAWSAAGTEPAQGSAGAPGPAAPPAGSPASAPALPSDAAAQPATAVIAPHTAHVLLA